MKKSRLSLWIVLLLICGLAFVMTACGEKQDHVTDDLIPSHTHSYSAWTSDGETNHKRTCSCGESQTQAHTFADNVCTVCGYEKTGAPVEPPEPGHEHSWSSWTSDGNANHKRTCECGESQTQEHTFEEYVCTVCGYELTDSEGLIYTLNNEGTKYAVTGIGTCTDTNIRIPATYNDKAVTSIGTKAFYNCSGLTSIDIPNSVTSIGTYAFYNCTGLTSITIPDSIESIGALAFCGCTGLTSIDIPDSVTRIGNSAFQGCGGLTSITVATGNTKYHSSGNCLIYTSSKTLILGCKNSVIPTDGVESIGDDAFYDCTGLTSIDIPDSVTSIGAYAFSDCTGLTSITFTGTKQQWNAISKGVSGLPWDSDTGSYTVHCTDGDISK